MGRDEERRVEMWKDVVIKNLDLIYKKDRKEVRSGSKQIFRPTYSKIQKGLFFKLNGIFHMVSTFKFSKGYFSCCEYLSD